MGEGTTRVKANTVVHRGGLSWSSLFQRIAGNVSLSRRPSQDDPYALGWGQPKAPKKLHLVFERMLFVTAEAASTLASLMQCHNRTKQIFTVHFGGGTE